MSYSTSAQIQGGEQVQSIMTEAGPISVQTVVDGLDQPWALAFLPDGRLLVTERVGNLRIIQRDGTLSEPVRGTPDVFAKGQGGLMDVALDPNFEQNQLIYLSFAAPGPDGKAATALGRGRLVNDQLEDFQVIFRQEPWIEGPYHFGNRIVFDDEGHLFLTLGERFQFDPAQDLSNTLGKVVRLNPDGSIPDNPFVNDPKANPAIWSYGHRNIEAAAIDPDTGKLWVVEMGPLGGDELNQPEAGRNYGWPVVSWGIHYNGDDIPDPPTRPEFADAIAHYSPVISPSGMVFYTGDRFPKWQGNALIGGLSSQDVVRLAMDDNEVVNEERIPLPERIRDLEQGPDGNIYIVTGPKEEQGSVWKMTPLK
ncbi:PQQ-dependent sugar dehydrogenase [Proteobacteria bacterium 005FR1]|nr:PQQ-dependent sugar dehydrogenase [Proteobacteria bacterium 005FR1]